MSYQPIKLVSTKRPFTPKERANEYFLRESPDSIGSSSGRKSGKSRKSSTVKLLPDLFQTWFDSSNNDDNRRSGSSNDKSSSEFKLPAIPRREFSRASSLASTSMSSFSSVIEETVAEEKQTLPNDARGTTTASSRLQDLLDALAALPPEDHQAILQQMECLRRFVSEQPSLGSGDRRLLVEALLPFLQQDSSLVLVACLEVLFASPSIWTSAFPLASKVFFHLSSDESNDRLLLDKLVIDRCVLAMGSSCPSADREALLYAYGAFKFLTYNPAVLERLAGLGFFDLLILHLKIMCEDDRAAACVVAAATAATAATGGGGGPASPGGGGVQHSLVFQATSCLRNVINSTEGRASFKSLEGCKLLILLTKSFLHNVEIMCNVSRIYSALSMDAAWVAMGTEGDDKKTSSSSSSSSLESAETVENLMVMLEAHSLKPDLVVRATFTLGNIASISEHSRMLIFGNPATLRTLADLLEAYLDSLLEEEDSTTTKGYDAALAEKKEDTVVKIIRVLANLSITAEVGRVLATETRILSCLLRVLHEIGEGGTNGGGEGDLLLSALSATCNLSYYPIIFHHDVCRHASRLVFHREVEVATEAARVLGNLTRRKDVRSFLLASFPWPQLYRDIKRMESRDFVFSGVGVLVNMMMDQAFKQDFLRQKGLDVCLVILRRSSDWSVNALACQLLWNLFNDFPDGARQVGCSQFSELEALLVTMVDGEGQEEEEEEEETEQGQAEERAQFSEVALNLLNKVFAVGEED